MAKAILDAIEQLKIYTTNKVREWKEIMQRPSNSEEQDRVATAMWETYRDMANRIAGLGELIEEVLNSEGYMNGMYEELLEKLRKNNRMSGWTHIDRLMDDAIKAIEALQQENNGWQERYYELDAGHSRLFKDFCKLQKENKQLQAKLDEWKYEVKCHMDEVIAREKQIEQLRVRVAKMRELLTKAYDEIEQTLAEIDKAIGGKEDE